MRPGPAVRPTLAGVVQDVAVQGDRIAARGDLPRATGRQVVDATGLAVAPGFIDMLSHSEATLIADGRSQGMIRQGVTLVVFGESSMGPLNEQMKKYQTERQGDIKFDITWNTLGQFLDTLAARGVSTNIASFAVSWRRLCNGFANRCLLYLRACPVRECSDFALSARPCMGSRLHANAAAYPPTAATILNPNTSTSRTMF